MKKSTITLIATAVGLWIVALITVAVLASGGQKFKNEEIIINENSRKITQAVKPFSSVSLSYDKIFISSPISIVQCDTIKTPELIFPEEIAGFISYTEDIDTLKISIKCSADDKNIVNHVRLDGYSPVTILTPGDFERNINIIAEKSINLHLDGFTAKKLNLSGFLNVRINSSTIDSINLINSNAWKFSLNINNSEVNYMKLKMNRSNDEIDVTVSQDSAATSTIKIFEFEAASYRKHQLTFDRITVNKVSYPGDNITLGIRNKAKIGDVYSNEKK